MKKIISIIVVLTLIGTILTSSISIQSKLFIPTSNAATLNGIDKRIGVHNQAPDYPYLGSSLFQTALNKEKSLGFQNYAMLFGPLSCAHVPAPEYPNGSYQ